MQKSLRLLSIGFIASVLLATISVSSLLTGAQQSPGSGLRVSPTRTELEQDPNSTAEVTQSVKNVTSSGITVRPQLYDFESDDATGAPELIGDPNAVSEHSIREFVTLPQEFDLAPDEEKELKIPVAIPANAAPGAYYGSVVYKASPIGASDDGQVALVASVGSLVLIEVSGDITEKIAINSVSAYLNDSAGSLFTLKPDQIGFEIENLGNGFSKPFGAVVVRDWRNNEIFKYELNDTEPKSNILPESTRLFMKDFFNVETKTVNGEEQTTNTSPIKFPGRYKITGNISHGKSGEIYTVESTFWYIPIWILIILGVILVALILLCVILYRKYVTKSTKRKNKS